MSRFFIDRPIFAWVIALVLMLAGALSIFTMPVSQYPQIAPPQVTVVANYPGASAETLQNTVTQVIEQQMVGLDGLIYMSNESNGTGRMSMTLTFAPGTNADIAQVQVNNKLSMAEAMLPEAVTRLGIQVQKSTASFLMVVGFTSDDGSLNAGDLGDYLVNTIQDPVSRITGVGQTTVFGASYAMRVWLDPHKLYAYGLTATDVVTAIQAQNAQVTAGQLGGLPHPKDKPVELNATITAQSLLKTVPEFQRVIVKTASDGTVVRLSDVARIELGRQSYDVVGSYNGVPSSGIAIYLSAGANAIQTADAVKAKITELSRYFPQHMKVVYPYETTPFVKAATAFTARPTHRTRFSEKRCLAVHGFWMEDVFSVWFPRKKWSFTVSIRTIWMALSISSGLPKEWNVPFSSMKRRSTSTRSAFVPTTMSM